MPALAQDWTKEEIAAGLKISEWTRYVQAGQSFVQGFGFFNPDCTLIETSVPTITKKPEHGTATIEMVARFPHFAKDQTQYVKCNEKKVRMPVLTYKAEDGYTGTDTFDVSTNTSNGMIHQYHFTIKTTDGKKQGRADRN
jgi:hypothetical protein